MYNNMLYCICSKDDVYTTSKKEFEESKEKQRKRFKNYFGQNSKLSNEVEIKKVLDSLKNI